MKNTISQLEQEALSHALLGNDPWKTQLRMQLPYLDVVAREYTGFGFFTDFRCNGGQVATFPPETSNSSDNVPFAWAMYPNSLSGQQEAISFNVFIKDGFIVLLEGASTATWPEDEKNIVFTSA
jgi:hypothetical protein